MTTSGTYTYNPSAAKIINGALRLIGAIADGETPEASLTENALDALNGLTKQWQASGIHLWTEEDATLFLQTGQVQYQIGATSTDKCCLTSDMVQFTLTTNAVAGASSILVSSIAGLAAGDQIGIQLVSGVNFWTTISGAPSGSTVNLATVLPSQAAASAIGFAYTSALVRPLRVMSGRRYVYLSQLDTPMIVLSRLDYANMPNKQTTGTVTQYFFDPQMVLAVMSLWPKPSDNSSALRFTAQLPIQDWSTLANTAAFPQEWVAPIRFNLAAELALEYDVPAERFSMLKAQAQEKLEVVKGWDRDDTPIMFGVAMQPGYRTG